MDRVALQPKASACSILSRARTFTSVPLAGKTWRWR
jgi:hypothetical protein